MKKMCFCFHMFFKSCVGFVLSNCLNATKNIFGIPNTQYSTALSVHKQPNVFNTTYTIQIRVNCTNVSIFAEIFSICIYLTDTEILTYINTYCLCVYILLTLQMDTIFYNYILQLKILTIIIIVINNKLFLFDSIFNTIQCKYQLKWICLMHLLRSLHMYIFALKFMYSLIKY